MTIGVQDCTPKHASEPGLASPLLLQATPSHPVRVPSVPLSCVFTGKHKRSTCKADNRSLSHRSSAGFGWAPTGHSSQSPGPGTLGQAQRGGVSDPWPPVPRVSSALCDGRAEAQGPTSPCLTARHWGRKLEESQGPELLPPTPRGPSTHSQRPSHPGASDRLTPLHRRSSPH